MKKRLAELTERLFKEADHPGLYILPLSTGGGKSYTIGRLACTYYPRMFKRIVILTIQNKLSQEMKAQLDQSISSPESLIKPSDVLLLTNNNQCLLEGLRSGSIYALLDECALWRRNLERALPLDEDPDSEHQSLLKRLSEDIDRQRLFLEKASTCFSNREGASKEVSRLLEKEITRIEQGIRQNFRRITRNLFKLEQNLVRPHDSKGVFFEKLPSLRIAYPASDWESKRVIYMTVHKALYGLDPIIGEITQLVGIGDKGGGLFIFDESDSSALSIRSTAAGMSIDGNGGVNQSGYGYEGLLFYQRMIENEKRNDREYWPNSFKENIPKTRETIDQNWRDTMGDIPTYNSIYLHDPSDLKPYRRGVFFSGTISNLYIRKENDKRDAFIGHAAGKESLSLLHVGKEEKEDIQQKHGFDSLVTIGKFLQTVLWNRRAILRVLALTVKEKYKGDRERYEEEIRRMAMGESFTPVYSFEPSLTNESYSLACRFGLSPEQRGVVKDQVYDYLINRKNIRVKLNDEWKRVPDQSVYMAGFELFQEVVDDWDLNRGVRLNCRRLMFTPEKLLLSLLSDRQDAEAEPKEDKGTESDEPRFFENNAVILSSATATCPSVIANLDINYLSTKLFDRIHWPDNALLEEYDRLNDGCYPKGHQIVTKKILNPNVDLSKPRKRHFPKEYLALLDEEAVEKGLPDRWLRHVVSTWDKQGLSPNRISYEMGRYLRFVEVYHHFHQTGSIQSFLFFQNRKGERDAFHYNILASLVDGSWKEKSPFPEEGLPYDWMNANLVITSDWEKIGNTVLQELALGKRRKVMLVAAYQSIAIGTNLQYPFPTGTKVLVGDAWPTAVPKKDWDGIYLQMPTHYLSRPELDRDDPDSYERQLYLTVLNIMMLYERGNLSEKELTDMLRRTVLGTGELSKRINAAVFTDACWWAQSKLSQAVGRICRTRYKSETTHILFDEELREVFSAPLPPGSYTKEFRALRDAALEKSEPPFEVKVEEVKRVNDANRAAKCNRIILRSSLYYYSHPDRFEEVMDEEEEESGDALRYSVLRDQSYRQTFKRIIIRHPVIHDWEALTETERAILGMARFYGDWPRDEEGVISFHRSQYGKIVTSGEKGVVPSSVSPDTVRLSSIVRCPHVRVHFEAEGIPLCWDKTGEILHPDLLQYDYAGEIGEEAFLGICYAINPDLRGRIRPLSGRDYEIADFVLYDKEGNRLLAFDVKNLAPEFEHVDRPGDTPTAIKREEKLTRLGCPLYTVNILEIPGRTIDPYEIPGIIREDGSYVPENYHKLSKLISDEQR